MCVCVQIFSIEPNYLAKEGEPKRKRGREEKESRVKNGPPHISQDMADGREHLNCRSNPRNQHDLQQLTDPRLCVSERGKKSDS